MGAGSPATKTKVAGAPRATSVGPCRAGDAPGPVGAAIGRKRPSQGVAGSPTQRRRTTSRPVPSAIVTATRNVVARPAQSAGMASRHSAPLMLPAGRFSAPSRGPPLTPSGGSNVQDPRSAPPTRIVARVRRPGESSAGPSTIGPKGDGAVTVGATGSKAETQAAEGSGSVTRNTFVTV